VLVARAAPHCAEPCPRRLGRPVLQAPVALRLACWGCPSARGGSSGCGAGCGGTGGEVATPPRAPAARLAAAAPRYLAPPAATPTSRPPRPHPHQHPRSRPHPNAHAHATLTPTPTPTLTPTPLPHQHPRPRPHPSPRSHPHPDPFPHSHSHPHPHPRHAYTHAHSNTHAPAHTHAHAHTHTRTHSSTHTHAHARFRGGDFHHGHCHDYHDVSHHSHHHHHFVPPPARFQILCAARAAPRAAGRRGRCSPCAAAGSGGCRWPPGWLPLRRRCCSPGRLLLRAACGHRMPPFTLPPLHGSRRTACHRRCVTAAC
jgi:hypothetical protein